MGEWLNECIDYLIEKAKQPLSVKRQKYFSVHLYTSCTFKVDSALIKFGGSNLI